MTLPPAFAGTDFTQWRSWPTLQVNGVTYYQIPGQNQYVFDPGRGQNGTILLNGQIVEDALQDKAKAQQPSTGQQLGAAAGQIAGVGAGSYLGAAGYALGTAKPAAAAATGALTPTTAASTGLTPVAGGAAAVAPTTVAPTLATPSVVSAGLTPLGGATTAAPATPEIVSATPLTAGATPVSAIAGPIIGTGLGLYAAKKTADYIGSAASGGKRNVNAGLGGALAGTLLAGASGGLLGAGVGAGSSIFGSHKDKYQQARDSGRQYLKQSGLVDKSGVGTLADGSTYDFDKGGDFKTLDFANPVVSQVVSQANLIAAAEGFTGRKLEAQAAMYANAALSNANGDIDAATANIQHFADQRKFNPADVKSYLTQQYNNGDIDEGMYKVLSDEADKVLQPAQPAVQPQTLPVTGANQTTLARPGFIQAVNNPNLRRA